MKRDLIMKKLYTVNKWVQEAREAKDWETYEQAICEYIRLANLLNECE